MPQRPFSVFGVGHLPKIKAQCKRKTIDLERWIDAFSGTTEVIAPDLLAKTAKTQGHRKNIEVV